MKDNSITFIEIEQLNVFYHYCTFVSLVCGKNLNYVNVFIQTMKNKYLLRCLRLMLGVDSNYEAIQYFLQQAPAVIKSKHVIKCINQLNKLKALDLKEF
jgi:hypothetical protein